MSGPATEEDAVSEMLGSIGEDPISDIENLPPSGNTALSILRATSRDLQEEGYWFNRETEAPLEPNTDGEILIPDSVLDIDASDQTLDLVERRPRLYDKSNKTFQFTSAVECDITYHFEWDELPSVARRYITALAIERFVESFPGADATSQSRVRNLSRALLAFKKADARAGDYNLLNNSSIQQANQRG